MVLALDGTEEVVGKPIVEVVVEPTGSTTLFLLITADIIFCQMIWETGDPTDSNTCTLYTCTHGNAIQAARVHTKGPIYKLHYTGHRCPT